MIEIFRQITKGKTKYSIEYWNILRDFIYDEKNNCGDFIISYLSKVEEVNVLNDDSILVVLIVQTMYPFKDEQIDQLTKSVANYIMLLTQVKEEEFILSRDLLLYKLIDTIFHNPEMINCVSNDTENFLLESFIKMSDLQYDYSDDSSDSYYKNYYVIQVINYFKNTANKIRLIDTYLNHSQTRLKEDMQFELNEYETSFKYYKN